jgi:hypothetical protein
MASEVTLVDNGRARPVPTRPKSSDLALHHLDDAARPALAPRTRRRLSRMPARPETRVTIVPGSGTFSVSGVCVPVNEPFAVKVRPVTNAVASSGFSISEGSMPVTSKLVTFLQTSDRLKRNSRLRDRHPVSLERRTPAFPENSAKAS